MVKTLLAQKQFMLFVLAGGLSAIVEIGLMKYFSLKIPLVFPQEEDFYGLSYPFSNIFSTILAIVFNYFLSIKFVFEQGKHSKRREFTYFMVLSAISTILSLLAFNALYKWVFTDVLDLGFYRLSPLFFSKAFAILIVSFLNYGLKKRLIFNG
jgi:putative flippase GtrA